MSRTDTGKPKPSTEAGNPPGKPKPSTEAGNPPVVVQKSFFAWLAPKEGGFVVLAGEPGAVVPGGAKLEVKNLATGEVTTVVTNEDGSFRAEIPGSFEDGFVITASTSKHKSDPVTVTRDDIVNSVTDGGVDAGDPSDAGPDASDVDASDAAEPDGPTIVSVQRSVATPAECRAATSSVAAMIDRSTAAVGSSCSVAEDCVFLRPAIATECSASCTTQVASVAGAASIDMIVRGIERGGCADFKAGGCKLEDPKCPPETRTLTCTNGMCIAVDPMAALSCESITAEAEKRLAALLASDDAACRTDADCTVASVSPDCFDRCVAYPLAGAVALIDALSTLDQACENFADLGCVQSLDVCTDDEPHPVCTNGRCARVPLQP